MYKQPWMGKPLFDTGFILMPPFLCLLVIAIFPHWFQNNADMPVTAWVVLVLLVDVAHVYSTLYRTYFDSEVLSKQRSLLMTIPVAAFIAGVLLYSINSIYFWRVLAYVAVFHFVRQQYGFMRLYSRMELKKTFASWMDTITIYAATLYPILYWHFDGPRNFNWFIEGDFLYVQTAGLLEVITGIYFLIVGIYMIQLVRTWIIEKQFNLPKFLVISGTLLSWYFGIVYFNGDMAFTLLNVVSHGIPYMAMIWLYGEKNYVRKKTGSRFLRLVFSAYGVFVFLGLVFLFAFIEEGLWDLTLWKERASVFGTFFRPELDHQALSLIVPLLALPQVTHYILDGFIWKVRKDEIKWNNEVAQVQDSQ